MRETGPVSPEGSGEAKASVGPASSEGAASPFPSPKEIFREEEDFLLKRRCPDLWAQALTTSVHPARAVPAAGRSPGSAVWRAQGTGGAGAGVKPNKPKATDYQQPLTTQEAHGGSSPTNTAGKLSDSQRKKV